VQVKRVALVLVALAASRTTFADQPRIARDADAWCGEHPGEALPSGTVVWRGRLDPDRREDVIVLLGDCGFHECMYGGYVRCRDGDYARVFTQYASAVRVRRRTTGWAVLRLQHVGELEPGGSRPRSWFDTRFGRDGYDE